MTEKMEITVYNFKANSKNIKTFEIDIDCKRPKIAQALEYIWNDFDYGWKLFLTKFEEYKE